MMQRTAAVCRQGKIRKSLSLGINQSLRTRIEEECKINAGHWKSMTAISPNIPNKSYPSMKLNSRAYHSTAMSEVEKFAMDVKSLTEMQEKATVKFGHNKCFGTRVGDGFEWISFSEFGRLVQKFRNVLTHHKIGKNDKVALISNNRVEWAVAFYAVNGLGGQVKNILCMQNILNILSN